METESPGEMDHEVSEVKPEKIIRRGYLRTEDGRIRQ